MPTISIEGVVDSDEFLNPRDDPVGRNSELWDMPLVEKLKQNAPSFSAAVMTGLAK
jgi:hypothetical protein